MPTTIKCRAVRTKPAGSGASLVTRAFLVVFGVVATAGNAFPDITPSVAASESTFFLSTAGTLQATGLNISGQLGIGDRFSRSIVHTISFPLTASQIWSGPQVTYVRKSDGTLWACGSGSFGLLGDGKSNSSSYTFVQVGVDTDWKQLSLGSQYAIGIKENGSLWGWGFGSNGALGLGVLTASRNVPTQIGVASDWQTVAAGESHNLAIKTDGTLWSWGTNYSGQVGNGTTTAQTSPIQIGTLSGWKSIAAGSEHSLAVRTDGSLWAWGSNYYGQLGNNSGTSISVPIRIGTGNQWKAVSAGSFHSLGQLLDNSLQAWGANGSGQLGVGDTTQRNSPTALINGGTWQAFDAGVTHSSAIRADGTFAIWGGNSHGQLGPAAAIVTTPQTVNFAALPEISLSISTYSSTENDLATDGLTTLYFPLTVENLPKSAPVKIYNHGTAPLSVSSITVPAGFSITPQAPFALEPGALQALTATIDTTVTGNLTGQLVVTSNDTDEAAFDVSLSGTVLSAANDTDGDGLNDAAEWYYSSLGFRWDSAQPTLVSALLAGASRAGMITETQLLAGTPDSTVIKRNMTGSSASLRLRFERSLNLNGFFRSDLSAASIGNDGSVDIPLTPGSASEFFRFAVESVPVTTP
ncbi:MAG: hypothetical protein ABI162_05035 [Luteolibacter sp.]